MHPFVVDYDPRWPGDFAAIRAELPAAWTVEHVGSTSVPGLAAKPIIDLDIVVEPREVPAVIAELAGLGWVHEGDGGIPGRDAFLARADLPPHHLYVVVAGGKAHRDHVDLRDLLRAHPHLAARYGALKRELSPLIATDRAAYGRAKDDLVAELLNIARHG